MIYIRLIPITKSEKANISIDFLAAVTILLIAFLFAVTSTYNMMTPYSGYTKELHPTADRAMNLLINDEGKWESPNTMGNNWETIWNSNDQSNVMKIGFLEDKNSNVLFDLKVNALMKSGGENWWEYPTSDVTDSELDNASKALGLEKYNFYMQIRPLNLTKYNETAADEKSIEYVGDRGDVVSVVRYSSLGEFAYGDFDGAYIKGFKKEGQQSTVASKALFGIDQDNYSRVIFSSTPNGIKFSVSNWTIEPSGKPQILDMAIDTELQKDKFQISTQHKLKMGQFTIWKDDVEIIFNNDQATSINLDVETNHTKITIFIPIETLDDELGNWVTSDYVYIQINLNQLTVSDGGLTEFSDTFGNDMIMVKTILWVW